jgi:hypothetical protein
LHNKTKLRGRKEKISFDDAQHKEIAMKYLYQNERDAQQRTQWPKPLLLALRKTQ